MRMIRVVGNMTDVTGAMCVFKGGNCLRQLDFLQFPLPVPHSAERSASRLLFAQPAGSNAHA